VRGPVKATLAQERGLLTTTTVHAIDSVVTEVIPSFSDIGRLPSCRTTFFIGSYTDALPVMRWRYDYER
jgi:hypothetical protein